MTSDTVRQGRDEKDLKNTSKEYFECFSYTSENYTRKHHEEKEEACRHGEHPQGELPFSIDVKGGEREQMHGNKRNNRCMETGGMHEDMGSDGHRGSMRRA
jgi:hypothetical protein